MSESSLPGINRNIWPLAVVVVAGAIMSILDTTIVNVAIETLSVDLKSPIGSVQWVVTGYMLALAAVIPVTGWAARRLGTRRLYLISLVLFTLGSLLCGFAWSTNSLIAFRILQGLGGGMLMPTGMIILARAAGPHRMGRILSIVGVPMVLAPVFGPVTGGLLVEHFGWRWIFFINIPVGIVTVALAWKLLPIGRAEAAGKLDVPGLVLLATGLPALTYGLAKAGSGAGFGSVQALGPIAAGIVLTGVFVFHSLRSENPLLNVRLYANRAFAAASATTFFLGASLFGAMILLPLYFQVVRGDSVVRTGLLLVPQSLGAALAMPLAGKLADRYGGGPIALAGVIVLGHLDAAARVRHGRHTRLVDRGLAPRPWARGRPRDDARDERRVCGAPPGADRRRNAPAHRGAASGRLDRDRRPRRRARHGAHRRHEPGCHLGRLRVGVLVGIRALGRRIHPRGDPVAGGAPQPALPVRAALSGRHRGRARGGMSAVAPGKPREAALEELRLALQEMLGAHRRLRSRDSRITGAIGFAHYRLLSELRREGALTASHLAQAADLAPATVTEMLDTLVGAGPRRTRARHG